MATWSLIYLSHNLYYIAPASQTYSPARAVTAATSCTFSSQPDSDFSSHAYIIAFSSCGCNAMQYCSICFPSQILPTSLGETIWGPKAACRGVPWTTSLWAPAKVTGAGTSHKYGSWVLRQQEGFMIFYSLVVPELRNFSSALPVN